VRSAIGRRVPPHILDRRLRPRAPRGGAALRWRRLSWASATRLSDQSLLDRSWWRLTGPPGCVRITAGPGWRRVGLQLRAV